jgi:hypothetical protein
MEECMVNEIILSPQVQAAIAVIIAIVLGAFIKRKIDYNRILPVIVFIIDLITKAEQTAVTGAGKKSMVINDIDRLLPAKEKEKLIDKFGSIANAVQWTFDKFNQPFFKKLLKKIKL